MLDVSWYKCIYIAIATMQLSWISLFDDLTASHKRLLVRRSRSWAWSRFYGAVPPPPHTGRLLALFAFPHTVTLKWTIESRKASHYR